MRVFIPPFSQDCFHHFAVMSLLLFLRYTKILSCTGITCSFFFMENGPFMSYCLFCLCVNVCSCCWSLCASWVETESCRFPTKQQDSCALHQSGQKLPSSWRAVQKSPGAGTGLWEQVRTDFVISSITTYNLYLFKNIINQLNNPVMYLLSAAHKYHQHTVCPQANCQ